MADVRGEAVACQERISLLPAAPRIGLTTQRRGSSFEEMTCRDPVGIAGQLVVGDATGRSCCAICEHVGDGVIRHALELQLATERHDPARTRPITALDPRSGEGEVVEVAQLDEPVDDLVAERRRIAEVVQATARLPDRAGADREERSRSLHDHVGVGDRGASSTPCLDSLSVLLRGACSVGQLLGLFDALHGDVDLGDLGADLRLESLRDVLV